MPTYRALLLDLQGVLIEDGAVLPGAVAAVAEARREGLLLRFVTNTATRHPAGILEDLRRLGFAPHDDELVTAPLAARNLLRRRGWRPHCLVHPAIRPLFAEPETAMVQRADPDCVLIGDARDELSYANLNTAFRLVRAGLPLLGIGMNRCFREGGQWMLDAGPFIRAIAWAADREPLVLGKPSPAFFEEVVTSTGLRPQECLMIGDDVEADVAGAMACGIGGCLVRSGKFQQTDLDRLPAGAHLIEGIRAWRRAL